MLINVHLIRLYGSDKISPKQYLMNCKKESNKKMHSKASHIAPLACSQGSDETAPLIRCLAEYDGNITPLSHPEYIQ